MARNDRPNRQPLFDTQKPKEEPRTIQTNLREPNEKPKEPEVLAGQPLEAPKPSENAAHVESIRTELAREKRRADDEYARCEAALQRAEKHEKAGYELQCQVEAKDKLLSALDEELKLHKSILEEMEKELRTLREAASKALPESGWSSPRARELVSAVQPMHRELLLGDLLALLAPHSGENGANETATDTLSRILVERGRNLSREESLVKECKQERSRADAAEQRVATLQAALVARRAPDATAGTALAEMIALLKAPAVALGMGVTEPMKGSIILEQVVKEWQNLRAFFSDKPLVALAVKDESTSAVADRFSLLLLEWDGKRLSPTALETVRPWGDIHPRLQHMLNTRLVPKPFR